MRRSSGIFDGARSLKIDVDHQELLEGELKLANGVIRDAPLVKLISKSCMFQVVHVSSRACFNRSKTMNIFYIIGVVVVILVVASFLGLHV